MHYDTTELRRQVRALPEDAACILLRECEYGIPQIQELTPQEQTRGDAYSARAIRATTVIRFSIDHLCGKAHQA